LGITPYAWSIRGERAHWCKFFLCGSKYSILPALSLDGILHLEVLDKAITSDDFRHFVQGLLPHMNQWPLLNSVLIIDNALIHKVADICKIVEEHSARLLYLPVYLPDFNLIKLAFSTIKAWLRTNHNHVNQELESKNSTVYNVFWEAIHSTTVEHVKGWYKHCRYRVLNQLHIILFDHMYIGGESIFV
jgi:transposase